MKNDIPWSFTNQTYKGRELQIDYFEHQALIWIDGEKITRVTAPESPLDWAHAYIDKSNKLREATLQG